MIGREVLRNNGPEDILGTVGHGFDVLFEALNPERIILAAVCTGLGRYALELAVADANERVVFTGPIAPIRRCNTRSRKTKRKSSWPR